MAVRQTSCRLCGTDIEAFSPYRKGEWRDRGGDTHCAFRYAKDDPHFREPIIVAEDERPAHAPYRDASGRMNV